MNYHDGCRKFLHRFDLDEHLDFQMYPTFEDSEHIMFCYPNSDHNLIGKMLRSVAVLVATPKSMINVVLLRFDANNF